MPIYMLVAVGCISAKGCKMLKVNAIDGNQKWTRVSKKAARKAWEKGERVTFCPCKLYPFGGFRPSVTRARDADFSDFDYLVQNFVWYNCTYETGYYPAFYCEVH
jgi:hypothetical protein